MNYVYRRSWNVKWTPIDWLLLVNHHKDSELLDWIEMLILSPCRFWLWLWWFGLNGSEIWLCSDYFSLGLLQKKQHLIWKKKGSKINQNMHYFPQVEENNWRHKQTERHLDRLICCWIRKTKAWQGRCQLLNLHQQSHVTFSHFPQAQINIFSSH